MLHFDILGGDVNYHLYLGLIPEWDCEIIF